MLIVKNVAQLLLQLVLNAKRAAGLMVLLAHYVVMLVVIIIVLFVLLTAMSIIMDSVPATLDILLTPPI